MGSTEKEMGGNLERGPEAYIWVLAFSFLFYFEKESLYIAQAVLECAVYTMWSSNSPRFACLRLPGAEKDSLL